MAFAVLLAPFALQAQQRPASPVNPPGESSGYSLKTSVRRVVVDIVATDAQGHPKRGLTQSDFSIEEDGKPQRILSFDPHDKDAWTITLPANLPPDTFIDLPRDPEQGPLYVLLYDMVNTGDTRPVYADTSASIFSRQQILKFVGERPPGTRFALLANSDGLHLIQGFTSDKRKLLAALDPEGKTPHMPKVFLYSSNHYPNDPYNYLAILKDVEQYVQGLPGRKNVIWVSRQFPFAVFAANGPPDLVQQVRKQLARMAANQIAIYPVDVSGVHGVNASDLIQDEVAGETGGRAFYGSNDLAGDLDKATADGEIYYTLSYSSTDPNYNGKLRRIEVKLAQPGYRLAYRHQYFADPQGPEGPQPPPRASKSKQADAPDPIPDTLYAYIRHGAPMSHGLLFQAHVKPVGAPQLASPEQMASLSDEPAYSEQYRKKGARPRPVPLQSYVIEYAVPSRQFSPPSAGAEQGTIEFAAAAYTADGVLLNGNVDHATLLPNPRLKYYPADQHFEVPTNAAWMCLAVRDPATGRIGNVEFALPLAPELPKENPER